MAVKRSSASWATAFLLLLVSSATTFVQDGTAQGLIRERLRQRLNNAKIHEESNSSEKVQLAGLQVAIWQPAQIPKSGAPLVIFSHGFHGINNQTVFLMKALAKSGYLVVSPNHKDALGQGKAFSKPDEKLADSASWTDKSHKDRADDINKLIATLQKDPNWNSKIDWSKLVLAGHSMGAYTVLGLAGAWPSWKIPGVKAVLALSPYCQPFAKHNTLKDLHVPVMYQSGTRDLGILPCMKRAGGAFDQTPSPAILVVFDKAGHFAFSNLNRDKSQSDLINYYSLAFLNKYVNGDVTAMPEKKLAGVNEVLVK